VGLIVEVGILADLKEMDEEGYTLPVVVVAVWT
jgi:hypothetical protein